VGLSADSGQFNRKTWK